MKNKKLLILIPALAMVLGGCKGNNNGDQPGPGGDVSNETVHPESVSLNETELALDLGAEATLTPTVAPVNASDTSVTWSSDHPEIVQVSNRGKLTAMAEGVATITVTTVDGGKTAQCVVTVSVPVWGTEEEPINITSALALADEKLTTAKAASKDVAYITGYVISASEGTSQDGTKYASNIYLADSKDETERAKKLLVYSADYNPNKSITALYPGDKVVVKGYLQQYARNDNDPKENWTLEVTKYNNINPALIGLTVGSSAVTLGSHEHATVTGLPAAAARNGSEFEFVVTPDNGYTVSAVTYNGENATPVEGKPLTYKAKVAGPTTILVTTVAEGVTVLTKEIVSPKNSTNLVGDGANNNAALGLDGHFVVTADKGEAKNNIGLYNEIRFYNYNVASPEVPEDSKKGNNNKLTIAGIGITFTTIVITTAQNEQYLKVMVNGEEVTGESGTYTINAKSFTITNSYAEGTASTQLWISKIVVNYTEDQRIAATGIEVSKDSVTLQVGKDETVTATVSPADSTDIVTWASNDETVATVVEGKISALKEGTCKVTATAGDFSKEINVTVEALPTFENLTGKTLTAKAEYYDEATGKGVAKNPCVLAGYVTRIDNATYGNGWMKTVDNVEVQLYGMYDITGKVRYDALETKPVAGDFIVIEGEHINYHNNSANTDNPELKNGKLLQLNNTKFEVPLPTAIAAPANPVEVEVGKTLDLMKKIVITPSNADTTGIAFASDSANATVDAATGVVTGVTAGSANITVTYGDLTPVTFEISIKAAQAATEDVMAFVKANTNGKLSKTGGSATGSDGLVWTMSSVDPTGFYCNDNEIAIGSGSHPLSENTAVEGKVTFTCNCTKVIKEVIVNAYCASGGQTSVAIKVGETEVLAATNMTTAAADYKGTLATPAAGTIVVTFVNTSKQIKINSITVVYQPAA